VASSGNNTVLTEALQVNNLSVLYPNRTHAQQTCTRNLFKKLAKLHKFPASNFDASSFTYVLSTDRAAFYN